MAEAEISNTAAPSASEPPVAGRDAVLPPWMQGSRPGPESPRFDSAVVRGNGLGALLCAARLARSRAFRGRVTVAAPANRESRRLIGGLTLRARSLDYYRRALCASRRDLLREMYCDRDEAAETRIQRTSVCEGDGEGPYRLVRPGTWMRSEDHAGRVLAYGVRNSALVAAVRRRMADLEIRWHEELPASADECRELALGRRPIVVDAHGGAPLEDLPALSAPTRFVLASQLPFADPHREATGVLPEAASFLAVLPRRQRSRRRLDIGVYNPIVDPLSPAATWYGIVYRIVPTDGPLPAEERTMPALCARYADQLRELRDSVVGVGAALGFAPVDEAETLGQAVVACQPWVDVEARRRDVLELRRIADSCAPIITGDGMARAGLAAVVAAECILAGEDPVPHSNRALRVWRSVNRTFALGMTQLAPLVAWAARRFPGATMGGAGRFKETWAGLE